MGAQPDWAPLIRASRFIGAVKPWEWGDVPMCWLEWTIMVEEVEKTYEAEMERQRRVKAAKRGMLNNANTY